MLIVRPHTALSSSTCLRCQLRQLFLHRPRSVFPQPWPKRRMHAVSRLHDINLDQGVVRYVPLEDSADVPQSDDGIYWRRVKLDEPIVGKPGRRRRETVASLPTTTLGRPAKVIVVHDIEESSGIKRRDEVEGDTRLQNAEEITQAPISAGELETISHSSMQIPSLDEVILSIDCLRPEESILDLAQFQRLGRDLQKGYTLDQMNAYLTHRQRNVPPVQPVLTEKLSDNGWRKGKTSLSKRHTPVFRVQTPEKGLGKRALSERVIREAWNIGVDREHQVIGEIETQIEPWQVRFLADVKTDGKSLCKEFAGPKALARSVRVDIHPSDHTLRVTGRRQDAEDTLRNIQHQLSRIHRDEMDFAALQIPSLGPSSELAEVGGIERTLTRNNLATIMQLTNSSLELQGSVVHLHSRSFAEIEAAKRLLLSLFSLPELRTETALFVTSRSDGTVQLQRFGEAEESVQQIEHYNAHAHQRLRNVDTHRLVTPVAEDLDEVLKTRRIDRDMMTLKSQLMNTLDQAGLKIGELEARPIGDVWQFESKEHSPRWTARLSPLLQISRVGHQAKLGKSAQSSVDASALITSTMVPGLRQLYDLFEPCKNLGHERDAMDSLENTLERSATKKRLVAHFVPSPFGKNGVSALKHFPRVQCEFVVKPSEDDTRSTLELVAATAVAEEVSSKVLLPEYSVDAEFSQSAKLYARLDELQNEPTLAAFQKKLQSSLDSNAGMLAGTREISVDLPSWVVERALAGNAADADLDTDTSNIPYLWQSLEEVETMDLVPRRAADGVTLDPDVRDFLNEWPRGFVLQHTEVEAGSFGGRRTELRITASDRETHTDDTEVDDSKSKSSVEIESETASLVRLSLGVANILTRLVSRRAMIEHEKLETSG